MNKPQRRVVASWSGGIDSTAVVANLLRNSYKVIAVTLEIYGGEFGRREAKARDALTPHLQKIAVDFGGTFQHITKRADWIWAFSPDGVEIPRRNKHIMDHLITTEMMPKGITNLAMGEYIGADTWLVKDHVGAADADHRSLSAYLFCEYGITYRLITLQDFGESRYKSDRVRIGWTALGGQRMTLTSNCLMDCPIHCGECYKCLERRAAFEHLGIHDETEYATDPQNHHHFPLYLRQMHGEELTLQFSEFQSKWSMPTRQKI